jgi:hypothetical protein
MLWGGERENYDIRMEKRLSNFRKVVLMFHHCVMLARSE